ncbi:ABC transporter ATP-binding protein [Lacticaseibacillus brantae]|uniref:ABC superfamily ATP binding cassette transporter, ABC protein n=1 Tax=Lacticaseibacillus brantae DSM 23927 TaxID=1423727 RepID=A0A0R2B0P1_9LACO|nr:ATP-binding cassette domain-containing protein [Lacticaseibacillus brantae]KRM73101.1 ABC superfamily ATP binding cassette transporter, ABC protein [Lacticaseibacillus brantae DSM 23927]
MSQLALKGVTVNVPTDDGVKTLLDNVNLTLNSGDFVSVVGTNGAGKSTLFNTIAGNLPVAAGSIMLGGHDITTFSPEKRARYIARVFQDPKMGTAPRMTVAENLALASHRGQPLRFKLRRLNAQKPDFLTLTKQTGNGLDAALDRETASLSGGQRQALSLLMASLNQPDLLLLDEHTAALDPHTSAAIMQLTATMMTERHLTGLMITHHMADALAYGNRLLVLDHGQIVADYDAQQKARLQREDLLAYFA